MDPPSILKTLSLAFFAASIFLFTIVNSQSTPVGTYSISIKIYVNTNILHNLQKAILQKNSSVRSSEKARHIFDPKLQVEKPHFFSFISGCFADRSREYN